MCLNISNVLRSINRALFSFSCIGSDRNGLNGLENSLGAGGSLLTEVNDLGGGGEFRPPPFSDNRPGNSTRRVARALKL